MQGENPLTFIIPEMQQTTLGRGGLWGQNPYNAPTSWEEDALRQFAVPTWKLNEGVGITADNEYRLSNRFTSKISKK